MARKLTLAALLLAVCCAVGFADDWPGFMGPSRNGISAETGLNKNWQGKPPQILWRLDMNDRGYSGPAVADGKVFVIDHQGSEDIVRALNLANGQQVWQYAYPDTDKHNYGFARSTPVYSEGKVYVAGRLGQILCLDAADGKCYWGKNLLNHFSGRKPKWDYAASPLIDGNKLVIQSGAAGGNVVALDKNTGNTLWVGGNDDVAGYSTAVIANILGRRQYVIFAATTALGVDPDSGRTLWSFPWSTKYDVNAPQPLVEGNFVFVTSGYGAGCALFEITPQGAVQRWANKEISSHFNSPIYYNGFIYAISDPGNLVCMSPQAGQVAWKQGGFEKGGLIIADGTIIALNGGGGDLVMVKAAPDSYQELGRLRPLGGKSWTAPILADGKLIIRNEAAVACLDLK